MRIAATGMALSLTLASAVALYWESNSTRRLDATVQSAERQRERLEGEIAALKAERAFLSQPARIEPAARALGLRPASERQILDGAALDAPDKRGPR